MIGAVELRLLHEIERRGEVLFGLAGKPGDEVSRDTHPGDRLTQSTDSLEVLSGAVPSLHRRQDAVRAGLSGQMHVLTQAREIGQSTHEFVRQVLGVRRHEADTGESGNLVQGAKKYREVRGARIPSPAQVEPIGVDVLTKQGDLSDAIGDQVTHLRDNGGDALGCARVRAREGRCSTSRSWCSPT